MRRFAPIAAFVLLACEPPSPVAETDAGSAPPSVDAAPPVPLDAGPAADATVTRPGVDGGSAGATDGGPPAAAPVDCGGFPAGVEVCAADAETCAVVFRDGQGCAAACAAAGLACLEGWEDLGCGLDVARPALGCGDTGHASDYCVCGRDPSCVPSCDGRSCGADGCGGSCGACGAGETCAAGACTAGPAEDCGRYPFSAATLLAERVGYGRHATGGDPDRVYHVTTLSDGGRGSLRDALESAEPYWIVFDVEGTITHRSRVDVRSNKTIDGRGRDVHIRGELRLRDVRNVIIADVRLSNDLEGHCTQAGDVLNLSGRAGATPEDYTTRDVWVHHVELWNGGDGLFDVRGGSRITMSWSHLHTHKKGMLLSTDMDDRPTPGMRLTFHHNFFDRITLRGPLLSYGWLHYFNNYQYEWYEMGAASLDDAQLLSERNVYQARPGATCGLPFAPTCPDPNPCGDSDWEVSKSAMVTEWSANGRGNSRSVEDLLLEGATLDVHRPERVFDVTGAYPYVAEPATVELAARIRAGAGPRVAYCR